MQRTSPRLVTVGLLLLAALLFIALCVGAWGRVINKNNSTRGDETANLLIGLDIREGRALTDGNRQPLFPLLLAPLARRAWSYYTNAKLVALACLLASVVVISWVSWRRWGLGIAVAVLALVSLNECYADYAPRVLCECILVGLAFVSWVRCVDALREPDSLRHGLLAGVIMSLVYLTKGTGSLMLLVYLASAVLIHGWRVLRNPAVWGALVAYVALASPLFVYNALRYGHPLYSFNSAHAFWFESWGDTYLSKTPLPTMTSYLASHSVQDIAQRLFTGVASVWAAIIGAFHLMGLPESGVPFHLVYAGIMVLGGRELLAKRDERDIELSYSAVLLLSFYVFFGWYYPVSGSDRFVLPVMPVVVIYAVRLGESLYARCAQWIEGALGVSWARTAWPLLIMAFFAALLVPALSLQTANAGTWPPANPYTRDVEANAAVEPVVEKIAGWAAQTPGEPLRLLCGPSHSGFPLWQVTPAVQKVSVPLDLDDWDDFERYLRVAEVDAVLLDHEIFLKRKELLGERLSKEKLLLYWQEPPEDWSLAMAQKSEITTWYLFRIDAPEPAWTPVDGTYGDVISLDGYLMSWRESAQGQVVEIDLLWRCLDEPERDWTAYVHLLDASGNAIARSDSYPMGGMYPTGRWDEGELVHGRHILRLDQAVDPAQCTLMVGFYDWRDGSRLPARGPTAYDEGRAVFLPAATE